MHLSAQMTAELENHCVCAVLICFGRVSLSVAPRTTAHRAPLSMAFSRQEYWSGLPCPPPGDLPGPGTEPTSPVSSALQADSLPLSPQGSPVRIITQTEISQPRVSLFSSCLQSPLFPPWSHSIPTLSFILFSTFLPPSSLFIPISYLTLLHVHLPRSPLWGGRQSWNGVRPVFFKLLVMTH